MTKTKSNRIRYLEQAVAKKDLPFANDAVSFILWVIAMIVFASLYGRTIVAEPSLTFFDALFMVMLVVGLGLGFPFFLWEHYERTGKFGIYFFDLREYGLKMFALFVIGFIVIIVIDFTVSAIQALTNIEAFLFFTFAAVAEEFFYRYFIATAFYTVTERIIRSTETKKRIIANITIVLVCAIITAVWVSVFFYYSHFTAYKGRDIALIGIFLCSIVLTVVYLYTKAIIASLLIHVLVNAIYAAVIYFGSAAVIAG